MTDNEIKELITSTVVGALRQVLQGRIDAQKGRAEENAAQIRDLGKTIADGVKVYVDQKLAKAEAASYEVTRSLERRLERIERR